MSLRLRLTLLYTSLLGGILLLFGALIYLLVGAFLLDQIDRTLAQTVNGILANSRVSSVGDLSMLTLPSLEMSTNVYVQYWDRQGRLQMVSPGIRDFTQPLDAVNLMSTRPLYRDVYIQRTHLRVLTAPVVVGDARRGFCRLPPT